MKRRAFIKSSSIALAAATSSLTGFANNSSVSESVKSQFPINFTRDGLDFSTKEYSVLLSQIADEKGIIADSYSRNGVVEELEKRMAKILGKESAIYMPTGTLANNIAIKKLCGTKDRVIVQAESHLYNDSGDAAQKLNNLSLIPLAPNQASFSLDEVKDIVNRTVNGRVKTGVGAISIESPVRRKDNEMFDFQTMKSISDYAKQNGIKIHLDGARLFNACVHEGKKPVEYASLFDSVYISLYKNFNAASGAVLAGSKEFIKDLYHERRMFGGGMPQVWPFAAVALQYLDSFLSDYAESLHQSEALFSLLEKNSAFNVEKIPNGTNVFKLFVDVNDRERFREKLIRNNIILPREDKSFPGFKLKINPSLLRSTPKEISEFFIDSL